ncbi:MAG: OprD family outer membrane porin [Saprospiraceae bacterium]
MRMLKMKFSFGFITSVVVAVLFSIAAPQNVFAQEATNQDTAIQITSPVEAFQKGHTKMHFRNFFMSTDNEKDLSDYYALGIGGTLRYETASFHGFKFGISGMFNYNLASSDLTARDSITGAKNRYEAGLFDVTDPGNTNDLDRLEELWISYTWNKGSAVLGKQLLKTPFINFQDGRMRPTEEEGIWVETKVNKSTNFQGGWLWKMSPRSTVRWYDVGASIGTYPQGKNIHGMPSGYLNQLESKGIGLIGLKHQAGKHLNIEVWDQFVENMFNTVFTQMEYTQPVKNSQKIVAGVQLMYQNSVSDGGNTDQNITYFPTSEHASAISGRLLWANKYWKTSLAYTYLGKGGRFLSPREWGKEPFYTFMPRERTEGTGNTHSMVARIDWKAKKTPFSASLAVGNFILPDVLEFRLNKYALPSYYQINTDLRYQFSGWLKGLSSHLLVVYKGRTGDDHNNPAFVINRVNMWQVNFILNYYL